MIARLPLVLAFALFASFVHDVTAQDAPTVVDKVFGSADDPRYAIRFGLYGATIHHVHLVDHLEYFADENGTKDDYLLSDVFWVNPNLRGEGYWSWLGLQEVPGRERVFDEVRPHVDLWRVTRDEANFIEFTFDLTAGLTLTKSFRFEPGRRDLLVTLGMQASAAHPRAGDSLVWRLDGLAIRSPKREHLLQNPAYAVGETIDAAGETEFVSLAPASESDTQYPVLLERADPKRIRYAGTTNRFFTALFYPADEAASAALHRATMRRLPGIEQDDTPAFSVPALWYDLALAVPRDGERSEVAYRYYLGPKSPRVFEEHPEYERFAEVIPNDFNPGCFCMPPGTETIGLFLLWLLAQLQGFVGNWGVAIMFLTILVRGALVPLNFRMQKSMRAYGAKTAKLKPKLEAIQKQYANDKAALQRAMVEFQREHKLFPPLGGCLPMFVTIPIFFGLFASLRTAYELRHEPFMLWVDDLSKPDHLFHLGIPYVEYFNLLPLIMVGLWWWLQSSTPLPTDPQQRQMMKIMRFMPFMFGVMLYNYASGLMVYMITSSCFALIEQRIVRKILGPVSGDAAPFGTATI